MFFIVLDLRLQRLGQGVDPFFLSIRELGKSNEAGDFSLKEYRSAGVQEIFSGVQKCRSSGVQTIVSTMMHTVGANTPHGLTRRMG